MAVFFNITLLLLYQQSLDLYISHIIYYTFFSICAITYYYNTIGFTVMAHQNRIFPPSETVCKTIVLKLFSLRTKFSFRNQSAVHMGM